MRLESREPTSESEFYTHLRDRSVGSIFWERVEPADESGFPDVSYVLQGQGGGNLGEGTIELKYAETREPNLRSLARGTQKAALLEYYQAGGKRRFALCCCNGVAYLWNTRAFAEAIRGDGKGWTWCLRLDDPVFVPRLIGQLMP